MAHTSLQHYFISLSSADNCDVQISLRSRHSTLVDFLVCLAFFVLVHDPVLAMVFVLTKYDFVYYDQHLHFGLVCLTGIVLEVLGACTDTALQTQAVPPCSM